MCSSSSGGMPSPSSRTCRLTKSLLLPALRSHRRFRRSIFRCIIEKIEQHLLKQHRIELEHRQVRGEVDLDAVVRENFARALAARCRRSRRDRAARIRLDRAGLEPGHVEQVGDEAIEPLRFVDDGCNQIRFASLVQRVGKVSQRAGGSNNRRKRRFQVMRDRREKRRAQTIGFIRALSLIEVFNKVERARWQAPPDRSARRASGAGPA